VVPRRSLVWNLGLGAFGLAFSITTTRAYLPPFLKHFTSSATLIASVIAAEGFFALTLPLVVGPWSDTFHTPLGRRRPFMLAALWPMGFFLALVSFMPNIWTATLIILGFYFAYYVYEPPYRGLYPDLVPPKLYGHSQSVQHIMRGAALGLALVGGGFLFKVWRPAPFMLAALVTTAACGGAIVLVREEGGHARAFKGIRSYLQLSWHIFRLEPEVRRFLTANAAWEGSFAAMSTFVVLYITKGLHQPLWVSSAVLATVAAGYVVAAICAGRLGDRIGLARVIFFASFVYGGGLLVCGFPRHWHNYFFALIFPIAVAGGTVMTLAWGLLFKLMPPEHRGAVSGVATTTKGFGLLFGPLFAGAAHDIAAPYLKTTDGYQIIWPVCAIPILLAIPIVGSLLRVEPSGRPEPQPS
jgi:MFS family permease